LVARLNRAVNDALADKTVRRRLEELGFISVGGTAESYAKDLAVETEKWRKVIKDSKIPPPA
jgi:tripartite-type tricarboxylate transporter receptor subunit TctC